MTPTSQLRAVRELEPPRDDEGFVAVGGRHSAATLLRVYQGLPGVPGVFVASDAVPGFRVGDPSVPQLVFGWQLPGDVTLPGAVVASCPHPGGPPTCWCLLLLPGLVLAFCHDHGVDPARSVLVERPPGTAPGRPR